MAFLTDTDYNVQLRNEIKQIIDSTTESTKLRAAEKMAIAQMKNYLGGRYNLAAIFIDAPGAGEDDTRDAFVVMIAIDLTLYHLWSKEGGNNIPETRSLRYNDALDWLKAVQKGEATDLPLIEDDEGNEVVDFKIWSKHEPESNRY
jgi:phage gp36-like protein